MNPRTCRRLRTAALVVIFTPVFALAQGQPPAPLPEVPAEIAAARASITSDAIMATVRFLASEGLEGREAGTRGADIAADYLETRFRAVSLVPPKGGFQQRFDLLWRSLGDDTELSLEHRRGGSRRQRSLKLEEDWVPFKFSEEGEVEAPVVFAGYGISAPEHDWDDYAVLGRDGVRGKIVLVFRHEPDEKGSSAFFDGREMTLHASLRQKAREAQKRGAIGLLVVDDPLHHDKPRRPGSSLALRTQLSEAERALPADDDARLKGRPDTRDDNKPLGIAAALISQTTLSFLDPARDWKALQEKMDGQRKPVVFAIEGMVARLRFTTEEDTRPTGNVLAVLPGSDPDLAGEYVVVGGHYDHLGIDSESGEIYYGADDNGSGTAAVVALAEAFASLDRAPARSILFAAWTGEEKGLMGSDWFIHNSPVPVEKIIAGINLDMIGRNDHDQISVVGRTECADLVTIFDRWAPEVGLDLNDDAGAGASRSDNASFWLAGVPTVSLFSGTHADYHQPEDVARKVVGEKVKMAAQLSFMVLWEIASGQVTPEVIQVPDGPWDPVAPPERRKAKEVQP